MIHVKGHNFLTSYIYIYIYTPVVGFGGDVVTTSLLLRQETASLGGRSPAFRDTVKLFLDTPSLEDVTTALYGNVRNGLSSDGTSHHIPGNGNLDYYFVEDFSYTFSY
jgi:hypothetical protein